MDANYGRFRRGDSSKRRESQGNALDRHLNNMKELKLRNRKGPVVNSIKPPKNMGLEEVASPIQFDLEKEIRDSGFRRNRVYVI